MYSRKELIEILEKIVDNGIIEYKKNQLNSNDSVKRIGPFAHYGDKIEQFELFARLCYGLLILVKVEKKYLDYFNSEILLGVNQESFQYWGDITQVDQRDVEMIPILLTIYFNKEATWDKYSIAEQKRIVRWFLQINNGKIQKNNWLFFRAIVNTVLYKLSGAGEKKIIRNCFENINDLYLGDGWYRDGKSNKIDYYNSFAFQFYGLLYFAINKDAYGEIFKKRAIEFSKQFIYMFSEDGDAVPYGRSLTYRFAQVAFWSMFIFTGISEEEGRVKGIIYRNISWWLRQPIFSKNSFMAVGYVYPNLIMSEQYNGYGSPLWALKSFIFLLLDERDNFWNIKVEKLPLLEKQKYLKSIEMTICRNNHGHVMLFNNHSAYDSYIEHFEAKYMKFVYSTKFGFSVPRGLTEYFRVAMDSMLSFSYDGKKFFPRTEILRSEYNNNVLYSLWNPIGKVKVESYIIPGMPWHVRLHKIFSEENIYAYESGLCVKCIEKTIIKDNQIFLFANDDICTGIVKYDIAGDVGISNNATHTNILFPYSSMPYIRWKLAKGKHYLITAHFCATTVEEKKKISQIPKCKIEQNENISINISGNKYTFNLSDFKEPKVFPIKRFLKKSLLMVKEFLK